MNIKAIFDPIKGKYKVLEDYANASRYNCCPPDDEEYKMIFGYAVDIENYLQSL